MRGGVEFLIVIGFCLLLLGGCVAGLMWADAKVCRTQAAAMAKPSTWGAFQGCMLVLDDGRMVPLKAYRALDDQP